MNRVVETARLRLRPFRSSDEPAYAAIRAKPAVARYLPGGEPGAARAAETAARLAAAFAALWDEPPSYGPWAVELSETGALIGHLGLRRLDEFEGRTELLYAIDPAHQGRGLATEGCRAALAFGFETLRLDEVIAFALPENAASLAVMARIGMRLAPGRVKAFGLSVAMATIRAQEFGA